MDRGPQPITPAIDAEKAPVRQLTRPQRRVLGVLIEKALTTPENYPLTLKAATTGCNQKSNRSPVTNYSEEAVEETLDDLRKLGLAAVVHTESGRTERYRHFMRQRYSFTESQLAIITELLLRGRQQPGELRARASRMVPIDTLDDLRRDLQVLSEQGYVQANGPLDRKGVEVDHAFYPPSEQTAFRSLPAEDDVDEVRSTGHARPSRGDSDGSLVADRESSSLRDELRETRQELEQVKQEVEQLRDAFEELRRELGA